jgi:hypothetical protein
VKLLTEKNKIVNGTARVSTSYLSFHQRPKALLPKQLFGWEERTVEDGGVAMHERSLVARRWGQKVGKERDQFVHGPLRASPIAAINRSIS